MMPDDEQNAETTSNTLGEPLGTPAVGLEPVRTVTTQHRSDERSFVLTVIDLLAEALEEDPMTMCPPLGDVIDPEILIRLRRTDSEPEQMVTFTYRECTVTATNHGIVTVRQYPPHDAS